MKEEKFYEKTYFVIGTCSFHGSDVPRGMRLRPQTIPIFLM